MNKYAQIQSNEKSSPDEKLSNPDENDFSIFSNLQEIQE